MNHLLRTVKLAMATMAVALGGLTIAAHASPAAHAASQINPAFRVINPTIKTSVFYFGSPEGATVDVQGSGFTPGGSVLVEEFASPLHVINSRLVTASPFCSFTGGIIRCNGGGAFSAGFEFDPLPPTTQTYYYIAYDYGSHRWSNWSSQSII